MTSSDLDLAGSKARREQGDPAAVTDVVAAMHGFAGDLWGELPAEGNLVVSPYSVVAALGMVLTGADGRTAREIGEVLGAGDRFHGGLNALSSYVEGLAGPVRGSRKGQEIALDTANQLFGQRGVRWEEEFLDVLARQYGAAVHTVDFEKAAEEARVSINDWVAGRTHDRILDLLAPGVVDAATRLVLVNAIYLKAPWAKPFDPSLTRRGAFRLADGTAKVPMMSGTPSGMLAGGEGWQAARIPYAGGTLAMTVVLPDAGRLPEVERQLTAGELPRMLAGGRPTSLDLRMPRWTFRSQARLAEVLGALGMPSAFGGDADFTPMTEEDLDLNISDVVHQGFVAVDEHGTEAAAATAVGMEVTSMPVTQPFHVDRPFLFVVHDVEHSTPLFLGRVTDPGVGADR